MKNFYIGIGVFIFVIILTLIVIHLENTRHVELGHVSELKIIPLKEKND